MIHPKSKFATIPFLIFLAFSSVSCTLWNTERQTTQDLTDPQLEALRSITLKLDRIPPIDLSKYKDIEFFIVEDVDGNKWATLSYRDYKSLASLLKEIENYIEIQSDAIQKVNEFYQRSLERQDMDR